ncbi:hypothetical protein [Novosphingobium sediminicola]|uniref:HNH nuclease domain-containing protein n=1 Tax=Novosphingobium sediminicola TaxID=563162 RepID=A0A7W6G7F6_9SPHN|nr:hypothetical protein [Novosphingobium sediminicola]MBB3956261.1 hypothetical protein [Novosphingobium sediminicola]
MHDDPYKRERRKQARLDKLGTNDPHCGMCGESDWRTIEQHHVADHGRDETVVLLCRNCHRKVSDDQKDHPAPFASSEPMLETIGHFLLGLADMLRTLAPRLYEFGRWLIDYARKVEVMP